MKQVPISSYIIISSYLKCSCRLSGTIKILVRCVYKRIVTFTFFTQSFCRILEAAVSDGGDMLTLHLDHVINDLYDKVRAHRLR